ncbi:MAG: LysE family translocator [Roseibium sp.]|uniref:LysE family translocator n=1 Tax=Roseibium sp. TaxID=1936156 RepID=UPI001B1476AF|nr:LysE family translocator [Roseibium sp.]MBO6890842.1 LysE family translocator [Roseibium sp.]MBO6933090.1 LysE family translocator [Roseibium sp.]
MSLESWLAFVAASLLLTITPGPSVVLGMVHALNFGARKTLFTALGDITANMIQMLMVAVGLGVVISASETAFQLIKWGGVAVLVVMSFKLFSAKPVLQDQAAEPKSARPFKLFAAGFLVAIGNPKALVFFTAFFPQFIDPQRLLAPQLVLMCPTMAFLDFLFVMLYALGAKSLLGFLRNYPRLLNRFSGTAMMGAAGLMAMSR